MQLRGKRFGGFKFRRQHQDLTADFCCIAQRLIIEVDGGQDAEPDEEPKGASRTAYLSRRGYRVVRFSNKQVNEEIKDVLEAIYYALANS